MTRRPPLLYRLALRLLAPAILAHLVWRTARDGGLSYFKERLGFTEPSSARLWIHCASVGEVQTVLPLLDALIAGEPGTILLTTNTPTGKAMLAARQMPHVEHRYLPLDFEGAVQRFLAGNQLAAGWIMETEIWPSLFAACRRHDLKLSIINARLSHKSRDPSNGFVRRLYKHTLESVDVLARSDDEAKAFVRLGAEPAHVDVVGNLKFAARSSSVLHGDNRDQAPALITRPYCVAASTHADEELQIAKAWIAANTGTLLVIVPRHPERGPSIVAELIQIPGSPFVSLRSKKQIPGPDDRLYMANTIGELQDWYAHAIAVFVGGSLIERGGQNMLEPVREGCPVVVGPHTDNFPDVMAELRLASAIYEADSAQDVVAFMTAACSGSASALDFGKRASEVATRLDSNYIVTAYLERLT